MQIINHPTFELSMLEKELQELFASLSKEWDCALKSQKKEDADAFMAKWVEGVQALCAKTNILSGKEDRCPDKLTSSQGPKVLTPLETEAMRRLVKKLHIDAQRSETESVSPLLSLSLEVKSNRRAQSFMIPVSLMNLYQGMVVLEADYLGVLKNLRTFQRKKATLCLTDQQNQKTMNIDGIMTWTPSKIDNKIAINLRMEGLEKNKEATKILENSFPAASKTQQLLWKLWDETQATKGEEISEQKTNFILLLFACGTLAAGFIEPWLYKSMQFILSSLSLGKIIKVIKER
jgi:hypothetical protein